MSCRQEMVYWCSWGLIAFALTYLIKQSRAETPYGRYMKMSPGTWMLPAKVAWFLQELPSFLVPLLLLYTADAGDISAIGRNLLLLTFCLHYFQRTFIYSLLNKGRPFPLSIMVSAMIFCTFNGFFQGYNLLHCAQYNKTWLTDIRLWIGGLFDYISGANFFGEILEWIGYAIATWSMPAFSFALFTVCSIGPRAYHHHRFYLKNFEDYPKSRKSLIPFIF